jgi:hypothetical protein
MRLVLPLTLALTLAGCGDDAVPPPRAGAAPSTAARPDEAVLARLRAGDPVGLRAAAQAIVAGGDVATRRAASARLAAQARVAASPAALAQLLAAMEIVGGPEVVAYCLALGEYEAAPVELRRSALAVLIRWADRNDPSIRARSAAIWTRVNAAPAGAPVAQGPVPSATAAVAAPKGPAESVSIGAATVRGGSVPNAQAAIAAIGAGLRRCYDKALQENAGASGTVQVTARVDPGGAVSVLDESHTGLTPEMVSCVVTQVQAAAFARPEGGAATVVIPMTFKAERR